MASLVMSRMSIEEQLAFADQHKRRQYAEGVRQEQVRNWHLRQLQEIRRVEGAVGDLVKTRVGRVHFDGSTALLDAAARQEVEEVQRLLENGADPDFANRDGVTALHQCCVDDNVLVMRLLLDYGADVNVRDCEWWTPLHAAARCGHVFIANPLVERGADLVALNMDWLIPSDLTDGYTREYLEGEMEKQGITPEMVREMKNAPGKHMLAELQYIVSRGGDIEHRDHQGATPLHTAASNGFLNVIRFILDNGGSPHVCDKDLWRPVHAAAHRGRMDVVEILADAGADLTAKTLWGEAPIDFCRNAKTKHCMAQLIRKHKKAKAPLHTHQGKRVSRLYDPRSQPVFKRFMRDKTLIARFEAREEARVLEEILETTTSMEQRELMNARARLSSYENEKKGNLSTRSKDSDKQKGAVQKIKNIVRKVKVVEKVKNACKEDKIAEEIKVADVESSDENNVEVSESTDVKVRKVASVKPSEVTYVKAIEEVDVAAIEEADVAAIEAADVVAIEAADVAAIEEADVAKEDINQNTRAERYRKTSKEGQPIVVEHNIHDPSEEEIKWTEVDLHPVVNHVEDLRDINVRVHVTVNSNPSQSSDVTTLKGYVKDLRGESWRRCAKTPQRSGGEAVSSTNHRLAAAYLNKKVPKRFRRFLKKKMSNQELDSSEKVASHPRKISCCIVM